jgi:predicted Zn-dependent protease
MSCLKFFLGLLTLLIFLLSCAVNPVTGKRELMLLSESDEIQLGQQSDGDIVAQYGVYQDEELNSYISGIGMKMAKLSHRPNLPYEFKIMDTPVINAFAVPGGYVYFTRGILAYLNSEAAVAGVMGHEIGHITARHSAKQYSQAQLAQLGLGVGIILSDEFRKYAGLAQFGVGMLFLKFSRDNERQADALGVEYSTLAGYNAVNMANFFETLDRMSPSENSSGLNEWFSTHPNPEDRVVKVKEMALEWQQKIGKQDFKIGQDEYLKKIDGLVFEEDPRQGYVENGVFYHPDLRFQFLVPAEWKLYNTPSQVQILSPEQDAAIILFLESGITPEEAASKFITNSEANVVSQSNIVVNGYPAKRVVMDIAAQQGTVRSFSYFISKEQYTYIFQGLTLLPNYQSFSSQFQSTLGSFKNLTDSKKIIVKPDRIRIMTVQKIGVLRDILLSLGVQSDELEKTSLLNGMELGENIEKGKLVKVIEHGR